MADVSSPFGNTRLPLICAPMFLVSYPELVLAARKANVGAACASATARSASEYGDWLDGIAADLAEYRAPPRHALAGVWS